MSSRKYFLALFLFAMISLVFQPGCSHGSAEVDENQAMKTMLAEFDAYAAQGRSDWEIPGMVVAVVRGDEVLFQKAYGVKQKGGTDPVTVNTLFQIGSASKSFTTALLAMDVSDNRYTWKDPVTKHLDDFMMFDPWVTSQFQVVDLSAQRSGMAAHALDSAIIFGFGRSHVRDVLRFVKPVSSFRTEFAYQNNLFLVDAELIEKKSDKSWEDNVRDRIFKPLGMTNSSVDQASFVNAPDVAYLHHRIGEDIVMLPMNWPYLHWTYSYGPAGGINSNIIDMTKWVKLHYNNGNFNGEQLIKEENAIFVHSPQTIFPAAPNQPGQYYCQGWVYREYDPYPIIWHNGGTSGFKTMVAFIPQAQLGVVVLSNLDDSMLPEALAWRFFDMYFGHDFRDWSAEELEKAKKAREQAEANRPQPPLHPQPPMLMTKYVGTYYNPVFQTVTVGLQGEGLVVTVGPLQTQIFLRTWDGNTFMGSWNLFTEDEDINFVRFDVDPAGDPSEMTIDYLNYDGCGVFERL
jgi:CubicO group peptidase (beta-lactamase class C family)